MMRFVLISTLTVTVALGAAPQTTDETMQNEKVARPLAGAGEVLVSATTYDLLDGSGLAFDLHGEHELKGLRGKRAVFTLHRQASTVDGAPF